MLGMCESCVAPILIHIITMFYKKDEQVWVSASCIDVVCDNVALQGTRVSWFYVMVRRLLPFMIADIC